MRGAWWAALRSAMVERGITAAGGVDTAGVADPAPRTPLFTMRSPTLRVILAQMMKPSQNQVAEILFKTLGRERTGVGTADSGRRVVERQLVAWGADTAGFAVRDGSGVSRHDYVTPETIMRVLDALLAFPALLLAEMNPRHGSRHLHALAEKRAQEKSIPLERVRMLPIGFFRFIILHGKAHPAGSGEACQPALARRGVELNKMLEIKRAQRAQQTK